MIEWYDLSMAVPYYMYRIKEVDALDSDIWCTRVSPDKLIDDIEVRRSENLTLKSLVKSGFDNPAFMSVCERLPRGCEGARWGV